MIETLGLHLDIKGIEDIPKVINGITVIKQELNNIKSPEVALKIKSNMDITSVNTALDHYKDRLTEISKLKPGEFKTGDLKEVQNIIVHLNDNLKPIFKIFSDIEGKTIAQAQNLKDLGYSYQQILDNVMRLASAEEGAVKNKEKYAQIVNLINVGMKQLATQANVQAKASVELQKEKINLDKQDLEIINQIGASLKQQQISASDAMKTDILPLLNMEITRGHLQ